MASKQRDRINHYVSISSVFLGLKVDDYLLSDVVFVCVILFGPEKVVFNLLWFG